MKVAELREKAKEFEIETTGKKKAELVEEIYTTAAKAEGFRDIKGILQIRPDSSGIIHAHGYMKSNDDAFVPAYLIRSARLRTGDVIEGSLRPSRGGDKRAGLAKITTVNGMDPEQIRNRPKFGDLTPGLSQRAAAHGAWQGFHYRSCHRHRVADRQGSAWPDCVPA